MKCAIYTRTSTNQVQWLSKEEQIEYCKSYIFNHGWELQSVYQDTGNGDSIKLPGLQKLLKDTSDKQFDVVIVARVSRFSMKLNIINDIFQILSSYGVQVLSIDENQFLQPPS